MRRRAQHVLCIDRRLVLIPQVRDVLGRDEIMVADDCRPHHLRLERVDVHPIGGLGNVDHVEALDVRPEMHAVDAHVRRVLDLPLAARGAVEVEVDLLADGPVRDGVETVEDGLDARCAAGRRRRHRNARLLVEHADDTILDGPQRDKVRLVDKDALAGETAGRLFLHPSR